MALLDSAVRIIDIIFHTYAFKGQMSAPTITHITLLLEVHSPPCFTLERHRWIKWDIKGEN